MSDGEEFTCLTTPFWRELLAHCYRVLGSFDDAEDLVQETYLRAWRAVCLGVVEPSWSTPPRRGQAATRLACGKADKTPAEAVDDFLWLATLPPDGPTGRLFHRRQELRW